MAQALQLQRPVLAPTSHHNWRNLTRGRSPTSTASRSRAELLRPRVFPFDQAWSPGTIDQASLAPQIFALSLFPYIGFIYFLTRSNKSPPLMLFGFYFLLVFVGVSIPAGIYGTVIPLPYWLSPSQTPLMKSAKVHYGTSLSNVDWLHGGAEFFLCITNLLIVLGLRQGIREATGMKGRDVPEKVVDR